MDIEQLHPGMEPTSFSLNLIILFLIILEWKVLLIVWPFVIDQIIFFKEKCYWLIVWISFWIHASSHGDETFMKLILSQLLEMTIHMILPFRLALQWNTTMMRKTKFSFIMCSLYFVIMMLITSSTSIHMT